MPAPTLATPHPGASGHQLPASFGLSLAMHLLLFGALAFAVRWNVAPQERVTAELWGVPAQVEPAPPPPPQPEPQPQDRPLAQTPPAPVRPDADIALEQKKKRRAAEADAQRAADKKRKDDEAARRKAEADQKRAAAEADARRQAAAQRERDRREADLVAEMRRQTEARNQARAGGSGAPGAVAAGARSAGDTAYAGAVDACIRPHIAFAVPAGVRHGQYKAEFVVNLLPTREQIGSPRLVKPSGLAGFDTAVERAIRRCDPFPPKVDGRPVERSITVVVDPVEAR